MLVGHRDLLVSDAALAGSPHEEIVIIVRLLRLTS